jgi:hypothetical protein
MFLISGLTIKTGSTQVIDIPGSSKEPGVQVTQFGQQRDDDNQKGRKIHLRPSDEDDDPLAIMW